MFRSVITHAMTMALVDSNQNHTHNMVVAGMVHVTETKAVLEVEVNKQDVCVTVMATARVATHFHAGTVHHQIT